MPNALSPSALHTHPRFRDSGTCPYRHFTGLSFQGRAHAGASLDEVETKKNELVDWSNRNNIASPLSVEVVSTEARQETIVAESAKHDLVVLGASRKNVLKKLFFGSLAETVAHDCRKSLLIVYRSQQDLPSY